MTRCDCEPRLDGRNHVVCHPTMDDPGRPARSLLRRARCLMLLLRKVFQEDVLDNERVGVWLGSAGHVIYSWTTATAAVIGSISSLVQ